MGRQAVCGRLDRKRSGRLEQLREQEQFGCARPLALAGIWVACLRRPEFIRCGDRPGTLLYLDPPYWGTEHYYGRGLFGGEQFAELSAALQQVEARLILSLNDVPEVRQLFAWASIETVELSYQAGGAEHTKRVREVIVGRTARGNANHLG